MSSQSLSSKQFHRAQLVISRRKMLELSGLGLGSLAFASLKADERPQGGTESPRGHDLRPKMPHFRPRAKAVILLMQNGAPSQMDLFDPKPELNKWDGHVHVEKVETFQKGSESNKLAGTPFTFRRYGQCGMDFSDQVPHLATMADTWCMVRSMHTYHNNHTEGLVIFTTGKFLHGRPTLGSWVSYALGTENQNLPAFVVLRDPTTYNNNGTRLWENGWLPALYRGTEFDSGAGRAPVLNLQPARSLPAGLQRDNLALLRELNQRYLDRHPHESDLEARIVNYELAARMQLEATQVADVSRETKATRRMYGLDNDQTASYGMRCLLARRLVEAGVRFVQVLQPGTRPWDSHKDTKRKIGAVARQVDLPSAGLVNDLKARGLLDETLVIWGGEFGRLPVSQNGTGRDHNRNAFTLLFAGGGLKQGFTYGSTDDFGYRAVENRVSISDLHATILHQLGLDHWQLTYPHAGRDDSLTDPTLTEATVVEDLLA